jgi:transcription elongation GreA/GreB family factor
MESAAIDTLLKTKLAALKPGTYCLHRAWGVGLIKKFDETNGKLVIAFENEKADHLMDPAFCAAKLEILPETHIVSRHRKSPAEIQALIDTNPAELLSQILSAAPNNTMSVIEMETTLQYLMGPDFKRWLTNAKKRIAKDSRIILPEKKTDSYGFRSEPVAADDEVLVAFYKTKNVKKKIELAEALLEHTPLPSEVIAKLSSLVEEMATAINDSHVLTPGEKLQGVWVRDDLAKIAGMPTDKFTPAPAALLKEAFSLQELSEQLPSQYLRRLLDLTKETHADDWQKISFDLLRGSSGKFTQECISFLLDNGCDKKLAEILDRWLGEQSLKAPMIIWIIKNRTARRYSTMLAHLMTPKFFSAIFYAIDSEAIQNTNPKRIALVELLVEDKELIPELLATATPEVARDLAHTLLMNQGFETLTKRSLIARFIKQFPEIQSLISTEEQSSQSTALTVSWESLEKRKEEYQLLVTKKIPENKEAIAIAREHGDLKENSEYKMARQDNDTLMALKAQMETELRVARGTDFSDATVDQVSIGSIVELSGTDKSNPAATYTILGAWDGNPDKNILSYQTPLAQALIGRKVGDKVKVGEQEYSIKGIKRWVEGK